MIHSVINSGIELAEKIIGFTGSLASIALVWFFYRRWWIEKVNRGEEKIRTHLVDDSYRDLSIGDTRVKLQYETISPTIHTGLRNKFAMDPKYDCEIIMRCTISSSSTKQDVEKRFEKLSEVDSISVESEQTGGIEVFNRFETKKARHGIQFKLTDIHPNNSREIDTAILTVLYTLEDRLMEETGSPLPA